MARYFIEFSYKGTRFQGLQIQQQARTVQGEINKALKIFFRQQIETTTCSRTDTGVHALQNFLHVDLHGLVEPACLYNLNAILPEDIVLHAIWPVADQSHARFDAIRRSYRYLLYQKKNAFLYETAYFFPFQLDLEKMNQAAALLHDTPTFEAFAKRHSNTHRYDCSVSFTKWYQEEERICFEITANRFLRGMVRGLVGTQLLIGRGALSMDDWQQILQQPDNQLVNFSVPPQGLYLTKVEFPNAIFSGHLAK